jgi:UDP-glucose 4-epimerase
MELYGKKILVTGGGSFIGSHLVDELVFQGNDVTVIDNFSTGKEEWVNEKARIIHGNLLNIHEASRAVEGKDVVFHLAAVHGGREFIDRYPSEVSMSFAINDNVIRICNQMRVKKLVFTSSVCVYPLHIQREVNHQGITELEDGIDKGVYSPDGVYGLT